MSVHRLDLGPLDLVAADGVPVGQPFWFETKAAGFSLGSSQAVTVIQNALMRDGEIERNDRESNRQITFVVTIYGADSQALAEGERILRLQLYRDNELRWTPPDGHSQPTAFRVLASWMEVTDVSGGASDLLEALPAGMSSRSYAVTLRCEPHGYSPTPVTQTLAPATVTPTVIDDCSTAANFAKDNPSAEYPTITAGTVGGESVVSLTTVSVASASHGLAVRWNGTKPTTTYVTVDVMWGSFGYNVGIGLGTVGGPLSPPVASQNTTSGTRYFFARPTGSGAYVIALSGESGISTGVGSYTAHIANIGSSNSVAATGVMSVATIGSVRAAGSVTLTRGTAMTWAFLYSDPQLDQFSPRTPTSWAGGRAGTYVVYAGNGFSPGAQIVTTVTNNGKTQVVTTRIDSVVGSMPWQPLGEFDLGGPKSGNIGTISIAVTSNGVTVSSPQLRIFRLADDTSLTLITGLSANTIEVMAPSVDHPSGGMWADNVAVEPVAGGFPSIVVPRTSLFIETNASDTTPPAATLTYQPRWHTYNAYKSDAA